jgi:hypothetical protein
VSYFQLVGRRDKFAAVPEAGRWLNGQQINNSGNHKNGPARKGIDKFVFLHCLTIKWFSAKNLDKGKKNNELIMLKRIKKGLACGCYFPTRGTKAGKCSNTIKRMLTDTCKS